MRYYYFNPFNKQYFFPEGFNKYPVFATFYKPYRFITKVIWKFWRESHLFRSMYHTDEIEKYIPFDNIRKHVSKDSILAFHIGGTENGHKINVLSVDTVTQEMHFIKYASNEVACNSVLNEANILRQLSFLTFVPQLQSFVREKDMYTLIVTTVITGKKMKYVPGDGQIMSILYTLSQQNIKCTIIHDSTLRSCFAHGDFCPWNMFSCGGIIKIFDWEMAGLYPLGYDLFTYIFQFEFLVLEHLDFYTILRENAIFIQEYFSFYEIDNWLPFLQEFTEIKCKLESEKKTKSLIKEYSKLKVYLASEYKVNNYILDNGNNVY